MQYLSNVITTAGTRSKQTGQRRLEISLLNAALQQQQAQRQQALADAWTPEVNGADNGTLTGVPCSPADGDARHPSSEGKLCFLSL